MYYPGIFLEGLRKSLKILSQDSLYRGKDLKPGPPEYSTATFYGVEREICGG
jgi:hypothetical protein